MAETLHDLVVSLSLQSDNYARIIRPVIKPPVHRYIDEVWGNMKPDE